MVTDPVAAGRTTGARKSPRSWRTLTGAVALVALALGCRNGVVATVGAGSQAECRRGRPPAVAGRAAFDNLSDDQEQGYLADGITEDLTTRSRPPAGPVRHLAKRRISPTRGKDVPPARIGSELGVRYLLEGSIRRAGDDMRISAQLIDTTTGGHLWAERYDGAWADVFEFQDKIVSQIATSLKLRLIAGQRAAQIAGGTSNPAAYEAYLRGVEFFRAPRQTGGLCQGRRAVRAGHRARPGLRRRRCQNSPRSIGPHPA